MSGNQPRSSGRKKKTSKGSKKVGSSTKKSASKKKQAAVKKKTGANKAENSNLESLTQGINGLSQTDLEQVLKNLPMESLEYVAVQGPAELVERYRAENVISQARERAQSIIYSVLVNSNKRAPRGVRTELKELGKITGVNYNVQLNFSLTVVKATNGQLPELDDLEKKLKQQSGKTRSANAKVASLEGELGTTRKELEKVQNSNDPYLEFLKERLEALTPEAITSAYNNQDENKFKDLVKSTKYQEGGKGRAQSTPLTNLLNFYKTLRDEVSKSAENLSALEKAKVEDIDAVYQIEDADERQRKKDEIIAAIKAEASGDNALASLVEGYFGLMDQLYGLLDEEKKRASEAEEKAEKADEKAEKADERAEKAEEYTTFVSQAMQLVSYDSLSEAYQDKDKRKELLKKTKKDGKDTPLTKIAEEGFKVLESAEQDNGSPYHEFVSTKFAEIQYSNMIDRAVFDEDLYQDLLRQSLWSEEEGAEPVETAITSYVQNFVTVGRIIAALKRKSDAAKEANGAESSAS